MDYDQLRNDSIKTLHGGLFCQYSHLLINLLIHLF